jgi:argininosuccinate lyase
MYIDEVITKKTPNKDNLCTIYTQLQNANVFEPQHWTKHIMQMLSMQHWMSEAKGLLY